MPPSAAEPLLLLLCSACGLPPRRCSNSGKVIPLKKCTRCCMVAYHDTKCQRQHYPTHKKQCRTFDKTSSSATSSRRPSSSSSSHQEESYRIEHHPVRGKCLVANRVIESGQSLGPGSSGFTPLVPPVLFENHRSSRCALCFSPKTDNDNNNNNNMLCQEERYMVHTCQTCRAESEQVRQLQREVEAVVRQAGHIPKILSTAILVYRICVAVAQQHISWELVESMMAHPALRLPEAAVHQQAIVVTVVSLLQRTQGMPYSTMEMIPRIPAILARIKVNAFTITSDSNGESSSSSSLGIGLYRTAHLINHSCIPNVTQSFVVGQPGRLPTLRLTSNDTIPVNEEITISYMDTSGLDCLTRRAELLHSYHFTCQCTACKQDRTT